MNGMDLGQIVQTILEALLALLLPLVVSAILQWLAAKRKEAEVAMEARFGTRLVGLVEEAVRIAVQAAEQSGLAGHITDEAESKKEFALAAAGRYLEAWGMRMDLDVLADMIEAEVLSQLNWGRNEAV